MKLLNKINEKKNTFLAVAKEKLSSAKNTILNLSTKAKIGLTTAMIGISTAMTTVPVNASKVNVDAVKDPAKLMGGVIDQLCTVAMYVGIGLVGFGLFQLFMAFKDEDSGSKSRAMLLCGCGIVLCGLKAALGAIGII